MAPRKKPVAPRKKPVAALSVTVPRGAISARVAATKPGTVRVVCAGHVVETDAPPATPPPLTRDSVTGQVVDPDATPDATPGWLIEED